MLPQATAFYLSELDWLIMFGELEKRIKKNQHSQLSLSLW